ncbi:amidase [Cryptosporangium japonicum]|uniref:Amidase n=1 Tax=Cryptosporangium japonicum TaxID=80872 RepID=A0ABN0UYZ2_9ACTN
MIGATATEMAAAVREGRITARELVQQHLEHIERVDPKYGAFRRVRTAEALREADAVDQRTEKGPLAGVPVAIKDHVEVTGEVRRDGSLATSSAPATEDHPLVRRWREAGAVVVGLTRVPELCIFPTSDDPDGVARSPWNPDYSAGGSSGGAGAAVAAGMVPLAHGSDGMGSIRIPAACCGVLGFKPGAGVTPHADGEGWLGLSEHGVLATTVDDVALGLGVMAGREITVRKKPLRVAISSRSPVVFAQPDSETRDGLHRVGRAFALAGHSTFARNPKIPASLQTLAGAFWTGAVAAELPPNIDESALQPRTRTHVAVGRAALRAGLADERQRDRWRDRALAFFDDVDVLVMPVLAKAPARAEAWSAKPWWPNAQMSTRLAPYPGMWNLAGFPALAVPAGMRSDGLPASVQLVGPPGSEDLLLGAAADLSWPRHPEQLSGTAARP